MDRTELRWGRDELDGERVGLGCALKGHAPARRVRGNQVQAVVAVPWAKRCGPVSVHRCDLCVWVLQGGAREPRAKVRRTLCASAGLASVLAMRDAALRISFGFALSEASLLVAGLETKSSRISDSGRRLGRHRKSGSGMPYCAPRGNVCLLLLASDDVGQRRAHRETQAYSRRSISATCLAT